MVDFEKVLTAQQIASIGMKNGHNNPMGSVGVQPFGF
jgi:hypothetical protein